MNYTTRTVLAIGTTALLFVTGAVRDAESGQGAVEGGLRQGAKVFLSEMPDNFHDHLKEAFERKKVPVILTSTREEADFEIKGTSESQKAGAAKKIFMGSWHSDEQASISVASVRSGEVVFAYSVNKKNSARGKRTTAEACAKHFKEALEKKTSGGVARK